MSDVQARFKLTGPNIDRDEIFVGSAGFRVGRSGNNDLTLDNGEISRHHMQITHVMGGYWVEDLDSSNGVWVNDLRVRPGEPHELNVGDAIRCGPFLFTFLDLVESAVAEPETPPSPPVYDAPPPSMSEPPVTKAANVVSGNGGRGSGALDLPLGPKAPVPSEPPPSQVPTSLNGGYPIGVPRDRSNWLQYLPAIYAEDDFLGRYLLIFESVLSPVIWMIDNFDLYLSPEIAPQEWLQWMSSWFDLLLVPELPVERQRAVVKQIGWLFLRRSTRVGLERLLELYFGVAPEILESDKETCHFVVRLPLSRAGSRLGRDVADRLITSQKPAFASYTLEIT